MIDKKIDRKMTIGGSEIDRLLRKKEHKTPELYCNCASEYCIKYHYQKRQFTFENSYTLYLEKIGVNKNSFNTFETIIFESLVNFDSTVKLIFDNDLIGEDVKVFDENEKEIDSFIIEKNEYLKKYDAFKITAKIENGNVNFGNVFENKILEEVNKELKSKFKEEKILRSGEFTAINLDGFDNEFYAPILEIKTADKTSFYKNPKESLKKYYNQVNRYFDVYLDKKLVKSKKGIIAVYLKDTHVQHWTKKKCLEELENFNNENLHIFEFGFDENFKHKTKKTIQEFENILKEFKESGEVLTEKEYNNRIFQDFYKNMGLKKIK